MRRTIIFLTAIIVLTITILICNSNKTATSESLTVTPSLHDGADTTNEFVAALVEAAASQEKERVNAYLAAIEQSRLAQIEQETMASARPAATATPVTTGDCENIPSWFPPNIAWRESHCSYDAYNQGGCGGYGCVGAFQIDTRHFSGWANGQSACGDLDATTIDGQNECVWRLSRGGTNFAPWGG